MSLSSEVEVYQLRVYVRSVSPMVWRRFLVRSDSTIADLHHTLQTVMEWHDAYLHHFLIRGKRYGIARIGTWGFMDWADSVQLGQLNWGLNAKFFYEYNYYDEWQLVIRLEARLPLDSRKHYPRCIGGKRAAPPEDCGGAWRFMELKEHYSPYYILDRFVTILKDPDLEESRWDYADELRQLLYWLDGDRFDRRSANRRLRDRFGRERDTDWFHVAMRLTVLKQMAKAFASLEMLEDLESRLQKVKWFLWHGNAFKALKRLRWMLMDVECYEPRETPHPKRSRKLEKTLSEFYTYIENNAPFIPNYGERYRHGECISTAFVESAVNKVVSRRMVKKQQMRWTQEGAHLLLQVRTKTLDGDLRDAFCGWYPGMTADATLSEGTLRAPPASC